MSDLHALTPNERLSNIRANEIKSNVGTVTSLAGLAAAGLVAAPQLARAKGVKRLAARSQRAERARKKVAGKSRKLNDAATKVFLYGAAPGAAVGLAHAATARQDAKAARRQIRRDGSLRSNKTVNFEKSVPLASAAPKKQLTMVKRTKVPKGGLVRTRPGSTYRRGGPSSGVR